MANVAPFQVDERLLEQCALSVSNDSEHGLSHFVADGCQDATTIMSHPCLKLYHDYMEHFERDSNGLECKRLERFLKSVDLVYSHNSNPSTFSLTLNHFSDRMEDELPILTPLVDPEWSSKTPGNKVSLDSEEAIREVAPFSNHGDRRRRRRLDERVEIYDIAAGKPSEYYTSFVPQPSEEPHQDVIGEMPDLTTEVWNPNYGLDYTTYINWATDENPDGVSVVLPPPWQGRCGSCWAFSATAALEANVARHLAHDAYLAALDKGEDETTARKTAQEVEQQNLVPLSVQELLDCDTYKNKGCIGGNPVWTYYWIHEHGLTTNRNYPYLGYQGLFCRVNLAEQPVVTVKSWGVIPPDNDEMMALVLRYMGPFAVGIYAEDHSFLYYRGGIYDQPDCTQKPDHAVIVVGYGQELVEYNTTDTNGVITTKSEMTKYWILRNSWGQNWGENGYMRMKRNTEGPGVCSLDVGPNLPIWGSVVTPEDKFPAIHNLQYNEFQDEVADPKNTNADNTIKSKQPTPIQPVPDPATNHKPDPTNNNKPNPSNNDPPKPVPSKSDPPKPVPSKPDPATNNKPAPGHDKVDPAPAFHGCKAIGLGKVQSCHNVETFLEKNAIWLSVACVLLVGAVVVAFIMHRRKKLARRRQQEEAQADRLDVAVPSAPTETTSLADGRVALKYAHVYGPPTTV